MSTNSNNNSNASLAEVPAVHSFEFDKTAIGKIKSSVNKFRGTVSLPLEFLSLPGREGLDVKISVLYSSSIKDNLNTWNIEAPTEILGLGWQMPMEMIMVNKGGSDSAATDTYYLLSGGSANPLIQIGTVNGKLIFELRNYQFWSIQYDPASLCWTIIKENGFVYTYGEGNNSESDATQWGVRWGNWIGSSNQSATGKQYPVAWNLATIVTPKGNNVEYIYNKITRKLINSGLEYTQSSYIDKVIDSYGRTLQFNYGNKYGALNSGTDVNGNEIIEYQAPHTQTSPENAYQDRYETLFLDSVDIMNADRTALSGLKFTYSFINNGINGNTNYPWLFKRSLASVFQYTPNGETLPAMCFEYNPTISGTINPGALKSVLYPTGGKAVFNYKEQIISSQKKVTINNPIQNSIPRVWFGGTYVAFTYCSKTAIHLKINSWSGQWQSQDFPISKSAVPESVLILTGENFISLSFRNSTTGNDELYLYRNDDRGTELQFGKWVLYSSQPFILNLKSKTAGISTFVAGDSFVMAYNKDYTSGPVQGFSYTWQDNRWNTPTAPPVPNPSETQTATITAFQNYYAIACYLPATNQVKSYIFYRDAKGTWISTNPWTISSTVVIEKGSLLLALSPMPTALVMTLVNAVSNTLINYNVQIFDFDENFFVLNANSPATVKLTSPISNSQPQYEVFRTVVVDSMVNNNLALLRNAGGNQALNSSWIQKLFTAPAANVKVGLANGEDVTVICPSTGNNQLATFNPNTGSWVLAPAQPGENPSISSNYMTIGKNIYYRWTDGTYRKSTAQLNNFNYPKSLQNLGPNYIAYQDSEQTNAATYVIALKNGMANPLSPLGGVKMFVGSNAPGTLLTSPRYMVTYPSSATSFDVAGSMDLYNFDEVNFNTFVNDTPVAYVEIIDNYDTTQNFLQSYFYDNSAESRIVYNRGVAQYPMITVMLNVKDNSATPPSVQPQGRSQFFYSNGLAVQTTLYPSGGLQNYQNILNGIQLAQKDFNESGTLVSSQLDFWKVYTRNAGTGKNLFGGYARCERTTAMQDGVVQDSGAEYDPTCGLPIAQEKTYFDAAGSKKKLRSETLYAWQVPEYAAQFQNIHNYASVAMTKQLVLSDDGKTKNYVQAKATTYRNWAIPEKVTLENNYSTLSQIDSYETFDWITPGSIEPQFPAKKPVSSDWQLKTGIISRTNPKNLIVEQVDASGLIASFIYDKNQEFLVAKFPNGSLSGGEVSYYSFENYEAPQGWIIGSGATIIPNSNTLFLDAHTGFNSLKVDANTIGSNGITQTFTPARKEEKYIFSAWVKKPTGFNNTLGNARWNVTVNATTVSYIEFPETIGAWVYVSGIIPQSETLESLSITICCENTNTASAILIDNLRFTPLACMMEAYSYNTKYQLPDSIIAVNGETSRTVYDNFQQAILTTNAADRTAKIDSSYFSRSGNQNVFTLTDPNHSLSAASEKDGSLTNFTRGSEWEKVWQPQADTWITEATILTQKTANLPGTLTYIGKTADDYTLDVEFNILETPTTPFGIQMGTRGSLQWNPQTALWQLLNANGTELLPAVDSKAFAISATPYSADLDNGIITPDLCQTFNRAGHLLSEKSIVSVGVTTSKGWTITSPDKRYRYVLKTDNNTIAVYAMNRRWILHVSKQNTVFWADGKMIFSFTGAENAVSPPTLFYGNRVAISNIATAMNAVLAVTFDDTRGETIQSQKYAESQMILAQNITDNIGRVAVRTKPAFITALQNPLFMFCANFAQMNWVTGTMTGLVNDAYPGDKGYPFSRVVFETSPLSRVLEESNPGELLRIGGGHTTRYRYNGTGIISGSLIYLQQTSTNANDIVVYEVRTLLDQLIKKVSVTGTEVRNETIFDDAGNPIELRSPNYFSPPANSKPSDWVTFQTFDFRNYLLSMEQGGKVLMKNIYDRLGNIRFSQDAQGDKSGTYKYTKYDILSRPIEAGYITGIWDEKKLQNTASSEAELPLNSPTWRTRNEYDGNQSTKYTIGRISQMQSNNANTGVEDVIEKLQYDILGNTLVDNLLVKTFDAITEQIVTYQYNDLNTITSIVYPESNGKKLTVEYQINCLNQIVSVSSQQISNSTIQLPKTVLGTFGYDATGSPLQNMLHLDNQTGIKQSYGYNSPYWLTDINNQNASGTNLLNEAITYTEGGYQHAEYFDGTIASKDITIEASVKQETKYQFSYDPLGQILNAENPANSANNLGVKPPISYDANGNFTNLAVGDLGFKYNYFNGTQQINNVVNTANNAISAQYSYDENGNVLTSVTQDSAIGKSHNLAFTYDPFRSLAVEISDNNATLHLSYGCRNERLVKQINKISTPVTQKLYIRGTNSLPLMERTDNGDGSSTKKDVAYIYGPGGLIAMYREDAMYHVLKDHLGSITSVLDMQGSMVASYQYLTYGALATVNEPVLGFMPYLYTGQEYDFETDLYNYRARFYSAGLGRFLSVDPGRQYFSPYIYASNNPVLLIDPTGMFSIGSLLSAIAGVIIGVVEILIGVVIDVVAGLVAFFSGGLGTPATIALAALSGTFYGAGLSAITYSVFNFNDFSWKDYGIQTAIGFVVGGITAGLGAAATSATKVVATAVQTSLSEIAASSRLLAVGIEIFGQGGLAQTAGTTLLKGGAWLSEKGSSFSGTVAGWVTNGPVTAGWKGVATGLAKGVLKSEAIGISFNTGQNLAMGNNWDRGLAQTIFKSALSGSINGLQIRNRVEFG